ncbi:MAG: PAS domain S-box protein [Bacteroidales bacterium]|nr:PAS domain S-box protein [Bacteroidales bacterium]MBN2817807.1 PAS domain S-box protein [Bacteroidales bacterium]
MVTKKNIVNIIGQNKNNTKLLAIILGILFILFSWFIVIVKTKTAISFGGIAHIHKENPILFLIELFPFIAIALIIVIDLKRAFEKEKFNKEIEERERLLDAMAVFAKDIGDGKYDTTLPQEAQKNVLAQSLLLMRENLLSTQKKENEQSWIAEGKEVVSDILRMNNKVDDLSLKVIHELVKYVNFVQGALYLYNEDKKVLTNVATYAYNRRKFINQEFKLGHGLIGECAYEKEYIYRTEVPDDYATITSGILGEQKPKSILIVPLISDEKLQGVIEFASIQDEISDLTIRFLIELGEIIARTIFNLRVNQRTEQLLTEAQEMTRELQENEEQLRQNAEEMRATQEELKKSNEQLEANIQKVEDAQKRLHSLLENASEIISIYDNKFELNYISPSVGNILGYTPDEMMSGKDMDRLTRKGEQSMREMFDAIISDPKKPYTIQYTYMKKNGQKIFLETTGRNLLDDSAIQGIILNSTDITERKRAEKEERMRSKMQSLSENSLDLIMRLSTVGQFFYANPVTENYLGIDTKDLINKTLNEVEFTDVLFNYFKETIEQIKNKPVKATAEITIPSLEDKSEERIMSFVAIPEFNENELETILFVGHDITEAKRIELEIQVKNRNIEDSINYAQRIQTSILPDNALIRKHLPSSFIFYRPRDVVSGDFPWFFQKGNITYIAAVDCTGHGVPGALLSFIGYFLLNNIVDHDSEHAASTILDDLHAKVRTTLKQDHSDAEARDGMDIAFCSINPEKKELQYSGAHRPLYLLRDGDLQEFKGDRKAIGGIPHPKKGEKDFTNYVINYRPGDKIFFFSDGLPDQLGGEFIKKYSPRRIRDSIVENKDLTMEEFNTFFANDFMSYKGDHKQIDDVLLIGIELT